MNFDTSQYYNEYISDKKRDEKPNRNLPDNTKAANLTFFCPVCQNLISIGHRTKTIKHSAIHMDPSNRSVNAV